MNDRSMLNYEVHSTAENRRWLVFIHGAGGSIKTWSYQVEALKFNYNLLLIDLRDHGRSKDIRPEYDKYTFKIISEDIKKVLDKEKISHAVFITLSFGSVLLQDLAMRYEGLVDNMIVAGGIFKGNLAIRTFVALAKTLNHVLSYEKMYSIFSYLLMPKDHHQLSRRIYQRQSQKISPEEYLKWVGLYGEFFRLLDTFYRYTLPVKTLVIMGEEDYVFLKAARKYAQLQPNASLAVLKSAGHICNIDSYEAFNNRVIKFLETINESETQASSLQFSTN